MDDAPTLEDLIAGATSTPPADSSTPAATDEKPSETETTTDAADATEAPEPAEAATETETDAGDSEADAGSGEDGDIIAYIRDELGVDLSDKYTDPAQAIKGLVEAHKMVGKRDEDALYGKALRPLLEGREKEFAAFLAGGKTEPEKKTAAVGAKREVEDFPDDADTWRFLITTDDKGKLIPAEGAPPTIVQDYRDYQAALARRVSQMARDWNKIKEIPSKVQEERQRTEAEKAEQQERHAMEAIQSRYAKALFVDGKGDDMTLTPEGQRVDAKFRQIVQRMPSAPSEALQLAIEVVFGDSKRQTKPPPVKPSAKAVRTPGVAAAATATSYRNESEELADRIAKNPDKFKEIILEMANRQKTGKLG